MSRSRWAWTKGIAFVSPVARDAGVRARPGGRTDLGRRHLLGAEPFMTRLVWVVAASVLVIGLVPAAALAQWMAPSASGMRR